MHEAVLAPLGPPLGQRYLAVAGDAAGEEYRQLLVSIEKGQHPILQARSLLGGAHLVQAVEQQNRVTGGQGLAEKVLRHPMELQVVAGLVDKEVQERAFLGLPAESDVLPKG